MNSLDREGESTGKALFNTVREVEMEAQGNGGLVATCQVGVRRKQRVVYTLAEGRRGLLARTNYQGFLPGVGQ